MTSQWWETSGTGTIMCPIHGTEHRGGYVRHRHRMVLQDIYNDLRSLLLYPFPPGANNQRQSWLSNPDADATVGLLGDDELTFIDYFPEGGMVQDAISNNTLALSEGEQAPVEEAEMGGMLAQDYIFHLAFITTSEATAKALFSDIADRYRGFGRYVSADYPSVLLDTFVTLHDYNRTEPDPGSDSGDTKPICVTRMEMQAFAYAKSDEEVPPGSHLYYGRLGLTDYLDLEMA